jgi:glycosyltransferase involved in cell wall biosynthesis
VSVLVPARDEAGTIGSCLAALRSQVHVPDREIIVLDDNSSDHTHQVVQHHTVAHEVRLVNGSSQLPNGWLGKPWACQQLADSATGDVLVFVDADVVLQERGLSAALAMLGDHVDAVCPYPRQVAVTPAERLIQPLLQWSWLSLLPLQLAEHSSRPSLTAANGQFLVISREAYDHIGGHRVVRDAVLEDIELFRHLKRAGRRGVIADGTTLASCRMYRGWHELRDGYAKSLWSAFGSKRGSTAVATGLALLYVIPPLAALGRSRLGTVGYLTAVVGRVVVGRRVGARVLPDAFAHPVSVAVLTYLTALSWYRRDHGELRWKGRSIVPSHPPGKGVDTT